MAKCRHKKKIILAYANYVEFRPDQEPYEAGVVESCGIETISVESIAIRYCPRCDVILSIETDGSIDTYES